MQNSQTFRDNRGILKDIARKDRVVIELGCGGYKRFPEAIGIDIVDAPCVDIIADLNNGLSFLPNESVDMVYSSHFLEHLHDLGMIMLEIERVLKKGGRLLGYVPHFSNPYYYSDYTHKMPFGLYTFSYFSKAPFFKREVPSFYNQIDLRIVRIKIIFYSPFKFFNIFGKLYTILFNLTRGLQEFYEGSISAFIPAYEIEFELEKPLRN